MKNGYIYEHRLVAEQILGRPLAVNEQVHHIDGAKTNNDPSNISIVSAAAHASRHHRKRTDLKLLSQPNPVIKCACGCGESIFKFDRLNRPRRYISGHNS